MTTLCAFDLYKDFAMRLPRYKHDDKFFSTVGLSLPLIGAGGRVFWGLSGDYIPFWVLLMIGNGAAVLLQGLMLVVRTDRTLYVVVCALIAILPGMLNTLPPIIRRHVDPGRVRLLFGVAWVGECVACVWYVVSLYLTSNDLALVALLTFPPTVAFASTIFYHCSFEQPLFT